MSSHPTRGSGELARAMPREVMTMAAETGLCRLLVPAGMGGHGLRVTAMARRSWRNWPMADYGRLPSRSSCTTISAARSAAQRLPRPARALSGVEPRGRNRRLLPADRAAVGQSDAANLRTVARARRRRLGDRRREGVGRPMRTRPTSLRSICRPILEAGWRGIACVLVDRETEGVEPVGPYEMMGGHAMARGRVSGFQGCARAGERRP